MKKDEEEEGEEKGVGPLLYQVHFITTVVISPYFNHSPSDKSFSFRHFCFQERLSNQSLCHPNFRKHMLISQSDSFEVSLSWLQFGNGDGESISFLSITET